MALAVKETVLDRAESANDAWDESNVSIANLVMRVMYTTQYLVRLHQTLSRGGFGEAQAAAQRLHLSVLADFDSDRHPAFLRDLVVKQETIERRYAWLHQIICDVPDGAAVQNA